MILILSDKNDSHADYVINIIRLDNLPYYRMNVDVDSLLKTTVLFNDNNWIIEQNGKILQLTEIKCVWVRRTFVQLLLEEEYDQSSDFKLWKNEWNKTLLGIYSYLRDIKWLNPWRKAYEAENKYLQMDVAHKIGFQIPKTIVSNDRSELQNFCSNNYSVVLKLMQQDFYRTESGEYLGLYVNKVNFDDISSFGQSEENPITLQEYIEKQYEVRYTVVGTEHFVCKIDSQASEIAKTDWRRYDIPNTPHYIIEPPINIQTKINDLMLNLGIEYGALDFVVDKKDNWFFLEINPMGQFLWIEDLTGLKIGNSIKNWLKKHL